MREKIKLSDTEQTLIAKMSEGNPGASIVLFKLIENNEPFLILDLDDMNIRGSQIWVAYKDYCKEDIVKFKQCITERDEKMVDFLNEYYKKYGKGWLATRSGASFEVVRKKLFLGE